MLTVDTSNCEHICARPVSASDVSSLLISCTISFIVVHPLRRPQQTAWPKSCHCQRIGFQSRRHHTACTQHPRTCLLVGLHYSVQVSAICRTLCLSSDIGIMLHKCKLAEILRQELKLNESGDERNDSFSMDNDSSECEDVVEVNDDVPDELDEAGVDIGYCDSDDTVDYDVAVARGYRGGSPTAVQA